MIRELYTYETETAVKVNGSLTNWLEPDRGARQGCCPRPTLFSHYIKDMVYINLKDEEETGRRLCIRFACDMLFLGYETKALHRIIANFGEEVSKLWGKIMRNENLTDKGREK